MGDRRGVSRIVQCVNGDFAFLLTACVPVPRKELVHPAEVTAGVHGDWGREGHGVSLSGNTRELKIHWRDTGAAGTRCKTAPDDAQIESQLFRITSRSLKDLRDHFDGW